MSVTSLLLLALAANGCSDSSGPQSTETQWVVGEWSAFTSPPDKFLGMSLVLHGTTVTGPGNWCDNLVCGTTSVTGTVAGNTVHMVTTFDTGQIETFDGTLESTNTIVGSETEVSAGGQTQLPVAQTFQRIMVDPV
ncbi:MAG TPA: hypothetical protein VF836_07665 [Gemmatimonadaceae bacterium]